MALTDYPSMDTSLVLSLPLTDGTTSQNHLLEHRQNSESQNWLIKISPCWSHLPRQTVQTITGAPEPASVCGVLTVDKHLWQRAAASVTCFSSSFWQLLHSRLHETARLSGSWCSLASFERQQQVLEAFGILKSVRRCELESLN